MGFGLLILLFFAAVPVLMVDDAKEEQTPPNAQAQVHQTAPPNRVAV